MKESKYHSPEELPLMLTVPNVANVLGIGISNAYKVVKRQEFPSITLGSRIIIPRDKFMVWLDEQSEKKPEIL